MLLDPLRVSSFAAGGVKSPRMANIDLTVQSCALGSQHCRHTRQIHYGFHAGELPFAGTGPEDGEDVAARKATVRDDTTAVAVAVTKGSVWSPWIATT